MSVKRYDFVVDIGANYSITKADVEVSDDGLYVTYHDYELLQSQNADLAVQLANAESKCGEQTAESHTARHAVQVFCDVVGANTDAICEEVGPDGVKAILDAMSATGNMPATDAFLAEVRAQGVEIFGDYLNGLGWDEKDIKQVREFADQLRKGMTA